MVDTTVAPSRRSQQRGLDTRRHLLEAALQEFSSVGFDAASTRAIAARAGVRQGQLTYHFETKDVLWRATVDHLFARFDAALAAAGDETGRGHGDDPADELASLVRAVVRAVSTLPELNRVMVHEATAASERLTWLVDRHVRARFDRLGALWVRVRATGGTHLDADPLVLYYCLVGAASLLYVNGPEARLLGTGPGIGIGPGISGTCSTDALVDAHADTLVAMLLGPRPARTARSSTPTKGH